MWWSGFERDPLLMEKLLILLRGCMGFRLPWVLGQRRLLHVKAFKLVWRKAGRIGDSEISSIASQSGKFSCKTSPVIH